MARQRAKKSSLPVSPSFSVLAVGWCEPMVLFWFLVLCCVYNSTRYVKGSWSAVRQMRKLVKTTLHPPWRFDPFFQNVGPLIRTIVRTLTRLTRLDPSGSLLTSGLVERVKIPRKPHKKTTHNTELVADVALLLLVTCHCHSPSFMSVHPSFCPF